MRASHQGLAELYPVSSQQHRQPCPATRPISIQLAASIKLWGRELGFQQVGITSVDLGEHEAHLQRWLDAGYQGEMDYMASHGSKRSHPDELVPGTLRVVSLRMDYLPGDTRMAEQLASPEKAYVSRYALGRDYHKLIRKRLQQLAERMQQAIGPFGYRAFVDSAPVLEKAVSRTGRARLDRQEHPGDSTARPVAGSSSANCSSTCRCRSDRRPHASEHCGRCSACLDICPTAAFVAPYVLDARRCISYLTIELKGAIPEELRPLIGNRVFGCDDCQIVCPWNRFARPTEQGDFQPRHQLDSAELASCSAGARKNSSAAPKARRCVVPATNAGCATWPSGWATRPAPLRSSKPWSCAANTRPNWSASTSGPCQARR